MRRLPRGIYEKEVGSKVYWVRYADRAGKIRREKARMLGAAKTLLHKRRTEVLQGRKLPETLRGREVRFEEIAQDTLDYSKAHKASYRNDKIRMARIQKAFGALAADSITPQDIERWFASELAKRAPATVNRYRALLSLTYRLGIANRKVTTNPARLVRQRRENNARARWLRPEEEERLRAVILSKCPHRLTEFELAINTGLRKGEQYSLTWSNVDFDRQMLSIQSSKNGDARHVPLNDAAATALLTAKRYSNSEPAVFSNRYGDPLRSPRQWFEDAIGLAGISDFRWHDLRHTFASRLVMAGVDLRTVQELMGHRTIHMTVRYAHLAPKHKLDAVQRLCVGARASSLAGATDTATSTSVPDRPDATSTSIN